MKPIVFSLGGSALVPDSVDVEFMRNFRDLVIEASKRIQKIGIVVGGGKTSRVYQDAARKAGKAEDIDLDLIGIRATMLNAELLRSVLFEHAYDNVIVDPTRKFSTGKPIIIASGWKPGFSTDFVAIKLAENVNANLVINVTNVDYVYDSNPSDNSNAKPIKELTWTQFVSRFGSEWTPGLHSPFDPVAAQRAEKAGISVAVVNGNDLKNIKKCMMGEKFKGTIIKKG